VYEVISLVGAAAMVVLPSIATAADDAPSRPGLQAVDYGAATYEGTISGGRSFRLMIVCAQRVGRNASSFVGGEVTHARTLVRRLSLEIAGRKVDIPGTAFADLYDVHPRDDVLLGERDHHLVIRLRGGDGAASFEVRYVVDVELGVLLWREGEIHGEPLPIVRFPKR
jgi:hypothetical protein